MMKEGDVVEIRELVMFAPDSWRPAIVIHVDGDKFVAQLLKDKTYNKWFHTHDKGNTYR